MGWNSGSDVFEVVYKDTKDLDEDERVVILTNLVAALLDNDWDVWDEVFDPSDAALVRSFQNNGLPIVDEEAMERIGDLISEIQSNINLLVRTHWIDIEPANDGLSFSKHGQHIGGVSW